MSQQWYWCRGGQRFGPVSREELSNLAASGQVQPTDLVWCQGMADWMPGNQVQGFFPPPDPRFPPPPPMPTYVTPVYASQQDLIHPSNPPKDPLLMGILSGCCIAGLGQMILGQVIKGVVILLGSMVLVL